MAKDISGNLLSLIFPEGSRSDRSAQIARPRREIRGNRT